jgi:hypothetical protein
MGDADMRLYFQRAVAAGLCRGEQQFPPRTKPPRKVPRFLIPAGTPCTVTPVSVTRRRPHRTKVDLGFERFESYRAGDYTFRHLGWFLQVHRRHVIHREDVERD